jgi:spore coat polysaccharide biosynthesis protein SpsF
MKSMFIWAVVAARMTSTRMPGKSMAPLASRPSLAHIITRLRHSRYLDGVVIATTEHATDDPIRACAQSENVPVFSGSEDDVLERTLRAAQSVKADVIVQVTGDCPLIDAQVVDRTIAAYLESKPDYASNDMLETYPKGMDTEIFSTEVLAQVAMLTKDPADREHVSLYIYEHPQRYRLLNVAAPPEHTRPELRLCIDTREDYQVISAIYDTLYPLKPDFGLTDIFAFLDEHPDIASINANVKQKLARI